MHSETSKRATIVMYGSAGACMAAGILARLALIPLLGPRYPYFTLAISTMVAARFWGAGPSTLFAIVGGVAGARLIVAPFGPIDILGLASYLVVCAIAIWFLEHQRRAQQAAAETARMTGEKLAELRTRTRERELEQRISAQLTAIVESSEDAIISKSLDGVVQSWNRAAEQIFGYAADEAIGKPISILLPPDRIQEECDLLERIRRGGAVKHFDTVRMRKDGKHINVSLTVSPIRGESGEVVGVSHIARDTTERQELEQQFRQAQKLESLGVLAGGLAHDFNNLLTGIMGNASLAETVPGVPEPARDRIQEVLAASERAALLVKQMLAYAGKGQFVVEPCNLSDQVSEIVGLLRNSAPKCVQFDLRLDPHLPRINCDRSQLQQVIMNLAINAAEAIGDRPGTVTISTESREVNGEPQVVMQVRDSGCGMDEQTKARIFDPFFTTKFTGRGLGLAAVMGIIRGHSGSISVESAPEKGSTFTAVFPARIEGLVPTPSPEQQTELHGYGNILVVDDEELVRNMAKFTLERCGYTVELAPDGRRAVDTFSSRPQEFAAVLLDLTMPVMSGEEALRLIRGLRPDVPVVLSSGFSETEALQRFRNSGLAGFLQKPYTATALARRIKQAVRKS